MSCRTGSDTNSVRFQKARDFSMTKKSSQILKKRTRKPNPGRWGAVFRLAAYLMILCLAAGVLAAAGFYFYLGEDLPQIGSLKDYRPPVITTVYSDDGRKIGEFYKERRIVVPLSDISPMLKAAFIAAEDARFYQHEGIDFASIVRAFFKNIEAGAIVQGGSTITQQVTKSFFLTPEKSYGRKFKEAILAYRIEKALTKEEILYLYLNQIYLGHGAYGVQAAAENYFGKSAKDLSLAECAMLAGLPQAPSTYSPLRNPDKAKERQIYVINRMVAEGLITNLEATEAIQHKLEIQPRKNWFIEEVPYYAEHVRQYVENRYGADTLYTGGLGVHAAVNIELQNIAKLAIEAGLRDLDKRQGYRGPLSRLDLEKIESFSKTLQEEIGTHPLDPGKIVKGVVVDVKDEPARASVRIGNRLQTLLLEDMKWARKPDPDVAHYEAELKRPSDALAVGDIVWVKIKATPKGSQTLELEQDPLVQGALLCLETETGHVKAMVGGRDYRESQFNRATQSRRQPGSAFKPIIYAAAIDKGYTPATVIIDSPIVFKDSAHASAWKPKNYKETFFGPTLFREALAKSRNVVTVKILQDIGIDWAIDYARKLGITSHLNRDLALALGASGVSLLELTGAYSVFANSGYRVAPVFITRILDRKGDVLEETPPKIVKVIEKNTAYLMTSLLESVVKDGTGWRLRALGRPVAGKTGTTNDLFDAWFVGYTPRYVTGVWVGFDEERSLGKGETGSRAASPIWLEFMKRTLADKPVRVFQVPEGVVFTKIDAKTGLLPAPESEKVVFECFKEGTAPTEVTRRPDTIARPEEFFKSDM